MDRRAARRGRPQEPFFREPALKTCPYCAEEIQDAAIVCRWCGRELAGPAGGTATPVRATREAEERLWIGRPGLLSHFWKVTAGLALIFASAVALLLFQDESWTLLAAAGSFTTGLFLLLAAWLGVLRFRYEVTTLRAVAREGLFSQSTSEIQLDDVRNVLVQKSVTDRLLGLGTVALSTAGQAGMEILFRSIEDPQAVVRLINREND